MKTIIIDNDANVDLPKWPAFVVVGEPVTTLQAAEIIFRTDYMLPDYESCTNDHHFGRGILGLFGIVVPDRDKESNSRYHEHYYRLDKIRQKLRILPLEYLVNSRIASAYIGGPHGWCDWSGNIGCNGHNIGKWPDVDVVATEWSIIAGAFPFLNLISQLYSGEECEVDSKPVVQFTIKNGTVRVSKPSTTLPKPNFDEARIMARFRNPDGERGTTIGRLKQALLDVYGEIPQYEDS